MKRLSCFFLLLTVLSQCTKPDTASTSNSIFDNPIDGSLLVDTVIDADRLGEGDCFVFKYDNLNRVTVVDYYEYLSFYPANHDRVSIFQYAGNDLLPVSVNLDWTSTSGYGHGRYKIYFFYNSDKSKNRDSIIDLLDNTQNAIRKYTYGPGLNFVKTSYYKNNNLVPAFSDSASFSNYNCVSYRSDRLKNLYGQPDVTESHISEASQFDNKVNPLSRLNIMPALFMNNCLFWGYLTDDQLANPTMASDFVFQNNGKRINVTHSGFGGGFNRYSRTCYSVTYDAKNRISEKKTVDSLSQGSNYIEFKTITYKYHN